MKKLALLLGLVVAASVASAGITTDEKYLLNNKMGSVATKVQLGTLIDNAEAVATADVADLAVTTAKLDADAVTSAKLADTAVSLEHLDSGLTFTHRVVAGGTFTTAGGDADESITAAAVVGTDLVFCMLKTKGASPVTIVTCAANTGTIDLVMSADPSTDHVVYWFALRASS